MFQFEVTLFHLLIEDGKRGFDQVVYMSTWRVQSAPRGF